MGEFIAVRDCVYNFKFIHKGKKVVGDLLGNENFLPVPAATEGDETPAPAAKDPTKPKPTTADPKEVAIRLRAKELKINNWHTKGVENLVKEIAAAEAAKADVNQQPDGNEPDGNQQPDGNAGE